MKKVKSYPSTFLRILAECIRIKYRADEKGVVVMNQKPGDFGSYSLPRLSLNGFDQEREPQTQAQRNLQTVDERRESRMADSSIINARQWAKSSSNWNDRVLRVALGETGSTEQISRCIGVFENSLEGWQEVFINWQNTEVTTDFMIWPTFNIIRIVILQKHACDSSLKWVDNIKTEMH